MVRFPSKTSMLRFLRDAGVPVGTVLDVGAQQETAELRAAFPDKRHLLFEPAVEFHEALERNYATVDHSIVPVALCDADGVGRLSKVSLDGSNLSHTSLAPPAYPGPTEDVPMARLDTFMRTQDCPTPYLLKVDVDGWELAVLRGAEGIWADIACIILEAPVESLLERMTFVMSRGFKLFDIVDHCYYHDMLSQVDLVFVAERLMDNPHLRPWETKSFLMKHWLPIAGFEDAVQAAAARKQSG